MTSLNSRIHLLLAIGMGLAGLLFVFTTLLAMRAVALAPQEASQIVASRTNDALPMLHDRTILKSSRLPGIKPSFVKHPRVSDGDFEPKVIGSRFDEAFRMISPNESVIASPAELSTASIDPIYDNHSSPDARPFQSQNGLEASIVTVPIPIRRPNIRVFLNDQLTNEVAVPIPAWKPTKTRVVDASVEPLVSKPQPVLEALGYAKSEDDQGAFHDGFNRSENSVAVYDISASTVYLPNGETLEAHSGIGPMRDKPEFVDRSNKGATPPHTYDLSLRESPFHGVEAIRLTPVAGDDAVFGRNGLLAHTYMLGKDGDSNGCVVFRNYQRFLAAFKRGDIKQLVVLPRLRKIRPTYVASPRRSKF